MLPKRLTPGFELRLSQKAIGTIFAVLAGSLALGALGRPK